MDPLLTEDEEERELLRCFFEISDAQIAADLASAVQNPKRLDRQHLRDAQRTDNPTPAQDAHFQHVEILLAYVFCQKPGRLLEAAINHVSLALDPLVDAFHTVANQKGPLCDLEDKMDAIRAREGLGELGYWVGADGPEDYRAAFAEYYQLEEKLTKEF